MKKFLLFLFVLVLLGCSKDPLPTGPEQVDYKFAPEGLSYIQLPVNRHYIYEDSATGVKDSVVVVTSELVKNFIGSPPGLFGGPSYSAHVFTLELKSKITNESWFSGRATATASGIFTLNVNYSWKYTVFIYPVTDRFIASMVVEGKTYADVEKYEIDYPSAIPDEYIVATYYWAKGVGIIKRQVKTATSQKTESLLRHGP